jgi:HEAT repeat protein
MDRLLRLSPGERGTVGIASCAAFLSAAGLTIASSGIDALVFARYGVERLPTLYLFLGGTMFVASLGVSALLGPLGRGRSFLAIPVAIGLTAGAARIALLADIGWIYPVLWLLRGAAEFLLGLAVWGLAGLVTDTRQAKRFFPLIGGAAVLGQVVGGLSTEPLASWLGTDNLIVVWMGALAVVVTLGGRLVTEAGARSEPARRRASGALAQMRDSLRDAWRSPLLRWMSVGSILFSTLFFSLYLPFSRAATARYPDADELAGFFGHFFAASTAVTLVLSLLVMNRLLSRLGVPTVALVLPLLYLAAFGVLTIASTFVVLLAFRFTQVVWLQGGASSAWEAVINTVPPERRDRMRAFLYGGPTQVGTVLAGLVAMVGERAVSPRVLYGIGLVAAAAALYAMSRVRKAYAAELVVALREGRPHVFGAAPGAGEPFGLVRADRAAVSVAVAAMDDPDAGLRRVAAELLGGLDAPEAGLALRRGLRDVDPEVRATALISLLRSETFAASDEIPELLADAAPEVRSVAVDALGRFRADWPRARALLGDPDGLVRASAAGLLLEHGDDDEDVRATLARLARSPHAEARAAAFRAIARSRGDGLLDLALGGLSDPAPSARAEAVRAVTSLDPTRGLPEVVAAIAGGGDAVLDAVGEALSTAGESAIEPVRRLAAGSAEQAVQSRRLADSIDAEEDERIEMLRASLLAASERHARTAIRAVALLGDRGAISTALESLSVADRAQRANALEVIETLGDEELVRPMLALWEPERTAERDPDWRERLLHDPDDWIRACARWATATETATEDAIQTAAEDAKGAAMTETMTTLPLMERVLFLRRVPLFSDLPPQDLKPIAAIATEQSYADADTIAEQGGPGDEMHIIVSGYVMVILREPNGHQQVIAVRSESDVIGEMAVITSAPRMASLAAKGPVRLLTIGRRQFEALLRERPETSLALMRVLCQRLADRTGEPAG